ncbi:MAG: hypothetical protein JWO87_785, partial [Phycisphaerales bacterium]|nr:hypothetical protein [Phycisphaerales bacterium]
HLGPPAGIAGPPATHRRSRHGGRGKGGGKQVIVDVNRTREHHAPWHDKQRPGSKLDPGRRVESMVRVSQTKIGNANSAPEGRKRRGQEDGAFVRRAGSAGFGPSVRPVFDSERSRRGRHRPALNAAFRSARLLVFGPTLDRTLLTPLRGCLLPQSFSHGSRRGLSSYAPPGLIHSTLIVPFIRGW